MTNILLVILKPYGNQFKCNYLTKNEKKNSKFFSPFLKFISNFEQFERKDDPHMLFISEITDCGRRA